MASIPNRNELFALIDGLRTRGVARLTFGELIVELYNVSEPMKEETIMARAEREAREHDEILFAHVGGPPTSGESS